MINHVVLVGRLTKNPDKRTTSSNTSVVSFTLAVDNPTKDSAGNKTTSFIPVTCWSQLADIVAKYTTKGSQVAVEGRLQQRTYDRKDGSKASVLEVIASNVQFLGTKQESTSQSTYNSVELKDEEPKDVENNDEFPSNESIDLSEDDLPW